MSAIEQTLQQIFGFGQFRPGQRQIIECLLAGDSALAVFPTGSGKSLCYQLPALHLPGLTLVVSPLIALMKDQIDALRQRSVAAARLDSSLDAAEYRQVWEQIRQQRLKLLYVAPERFGSERFLARLRQQQISLMVIDEAHCISEWGHNFRPDYLKLAMQAKQLGVELVLALTATATPAVAADIRRNFAIADHAYVNTGFYRPNLELRMTPCSQPQRSQLLLERLGSRRRGATIVYVTLQRTAEEVAQLLQEHHYPAQAYHAGMVAETRSAIQEWFMGSTDAIVVATIAFGMGIDKADIRYVYHYNLPKALENYAQEIGRAGRDGQEAICELFACPVDTVTLENFSYGDTPADSAVHALVKYLLGDSQRREHGDYFDVSVYELATKFDIRNLVISTLLCYLELEGVIAAAGPFYDTYKIAFRLGQDAVLGKFDVRRQQFLRALFAQGKKGRKWLAIELKAAAEAMGEDRQRLVAALNYLEEQGDVELEVTGLRLGYRVVQLPEQSAALAENLAQRFKAAEQRDIQRISSVLELTASPQCRVRHLLRYFGEELGRNCGHCDLCLAEPPPPLPALALTPLPAELGSEIQDLLRHRHTALATPRQITRFLCGLSSPAMSRTRPGLTSHPKFGLLATVPFARVEAAVTEIMQAHNDIKT